MDIIKNKRWVACLSQSGSELLEICKELRIAPDVILTTHVEKLRSEIYELGARIIVTYVRPTEEELQRIFAESDIVTLHGFLYIIPGSVCNAHVIYNGHPALLTEYPELKGKDKQKDAFLFKAKYPWIGSVLHEVVAELDAGRILISCKRENTCESEEDAFRLLKETSLATWLEFFDPGHSKPLAPGLILEVWK